MKGKKERTNGRSVTSPTLTKFYIFALLLSALST